MSRLRGRPRTPHVGPAGRLALDLLARCPRMPTDVVGVLLGHRQSVTTAQLLARLARVGLVQYQRLSLGPLLGSHPVRVWSLTAAGRASVTSQGEVACDGHRLLFGVPEHMHTAARQRDVPLLVACYRLLAEVARSLDRPVRVRAWEHPWIRTVSLEGRQPRHVRLPAAAVLESSQADDGRAGFLLLPDLGTTPLASYQRALQALHQMRRAGVVVDQEPVLVVGVATPASLLDTRVQRWHWLLRDMADCSGEGPVRAQIIECTTSLRLDRGDRSVRRQLDEVFAALARHPLLTRRRLGSLIGTSPARIGHLERELMARAWIRPIDSSDVLPGTDAARGDRLQCLGLMELTPAGQREASRRLLVSTSLARRRHGLQASGRGFLRHLRHTLGANAFFVDLASTARRARTHRRDDALLEWRSAAACGYGRFRPDGYGCYRRGAWRFGFFLEYDRGTERSSQYAAKLTRYYQYRDSGAFRRDFTSFPTVLVVTTSDIAEERFAREAYLAAERHGGQDLRMFLTTTGRITIHPDGALGPVWRTPGVGWSTAKVQRLHWLPVSGSLGSTPSSQSEEVNRSRLIRAAGVHD